MAKKSNSGSKSFQLTDDEAKIVNAMRAVKQARTAQNTLANAEENFSETVRAFEYNDPF